MTVFRMDQLQLQIWYGIRFGDGGAVLPEPVLEALDDGGGAGFLPAAGTPLAWVSYLDRSGTSWYGLAAAPSVLASGGCTGRLAFSLPPDHVAAQWQHALARAAHRMMIGAAEMGWHQTIGLLR